MAGSTDMKQKWSASVGCWTHYVTSTFDLDLGFSRSDIQIVVSLKWVDWLMWNEKEVNQLDVGPTCVTLIFDHIHDLDLEFSRSNCISETLTSYMTLTLPFISAHEKSLQILLYCMEKFFPSYAIWSSGWHFRGDLKKCKHFSRCVLVTN